MIINKLYNSHGKEIKIALNAKQKTFIRKNLKIKNEYGINYNGYGYADRVRVYDNMTLSQMREFNRLGKLETRKQQNNTPQRWAERLAKLTGIPLADAISIAEEKLEYKDRQLQLLNERQCVSYSIQRAKLMRQIERSNPLREIKGLDHALAILSASRRHNNTDYEYMLEEARDLAAIGEIDRSAVQEYARENSRNK